MNWQKFFPSVCFLLPFLLYLNSIPNQYNLDDELVTRNHPLTSRGISAIPDIFTSPYYKDDQGYSYGYRPVALASFAIEHSLFGETPHMSHAINVLLYAILVVVLFFCLTQLLQGHNFVLPFVAAVLFACHPLHTEVVCSIKNRDEILALLFGLLALFAAIKHINKKQIGFFVLSVVSFALAVFSKQSILSFAVLIPVALMLFKNAGLGECAKYSLLFGFISALVIPNLTSGTQVKYALAIASTPFVLSGYLNRHQWAHIVKVNLAILVKKAPSIWHAFKKLGEKLLRIVFSDYGYLLFLTPALLVALTYGPYFLFVFFLTLTGVAHYLSRHKKFNLITASIPLLLLMLPIGYDAFSILPLACYLVVFLHFEGKKISQSAWAAMVVATAVALIEAFPEKDLLLLLTGLAVFVILTRNVFKWKRFVPLVLPIAILPIYLIRGEEAPSMPVAFILFLFVLPGGWWILSQVSERFDKFCKTHRQGFFLLVSYAALNACSAFTGWFILNVMAAVIIFYALLISAKSKRDYVHFFFGGLILAIVVLTTDIHGLVFPIVFVLGYLALGFWSARKGFKPKLTMLLWLMVPLYFLVNRHNVLYETGAFPEMLKQQIEEKLIPFFSDERNDSANVDFMFAQSIGQSGQTTLNTSSRPIEFVENPLKWTTPYYQKLATCVFTMGVYLQKMVIPHPLLFYYGYKKIRLKKLSEPAVIATIFILITLCVFAIYYLKKWPVFSFGILVCLTSLFLFSNYLTPVPGIVGERLSFVASFGFCLVVAALATRLTGQSVFAQINSLRQVKPMLLIVVAGIAILYSVKTVSRNAQWHNAIKLMRHDIQYLENSAQANNVLASNLMSEHGRNRDEQLVSEAAQHFVKAIEIYPENFNAWFDLGRTYLVLGQKDKALEAFRQATKIDPTVSKASVNVALLLEEKGKLAEAIPFLEQAILVEPQTINLYTTLSFLHFRLGDIQKSIEVNLKALKKNPNAYEPTINLGKTYLNLGENEKAIEWFEKALALNPSDPELNQILRQLKAD